MVASVIVAETDEKRRQREGARQIAPVNGSGGTALSLLLTDESRPLVATVSPNASSGASVSAT
jgi:hypothetical protein